MSLQVLACRRQCDLVSEPEFLITSTSPEWLITFFALQCLGCEVVTMHTTLDDSTISYILNLNKLRPTIETTTKLINLRSPFVDSLSEAETNETKFEIFDYDQLIEEGRALPELGFNNNLEFSTNDIAVVMFTSGGCCFRSDGSSLWSSNDDGQLSLTTDLLGAARRVS